MPKPRILVTSAAGHTGTAAVLQLLEKGFPVRAFARRKDQRSERLRQAGAEVLVGDLLDMRDLRRALANIQRAYHCPPFAPNLLHGSMLFALAAEEAKLEIVVLMTAWNPHPSHPSIHQREHWLANNVYQWMPTVDVVYLNPGLFAFPYFFGLPAVAHFGRLMLPFGEGLNAPPSNEDIAAVAAGILTEPTAHIGKNYRPTGPKLLSGYDVANVFSRVLGRKVRYQDVPIWMFSKAAKALGFSNFEIAQIRHYAEEVRGGAYALSAPTDHVEQVCGRPAEDFEATARRYINHPGLVFPGLKVGSSLGAFMLMLRTMLTPAPDLDGWESQRGYPLLTESVLAHHSKEWLTTAKQNRLALLTPKFPAEARRV
ncbi:MAG: NmrA family NAD(P)-binding protein [Acidobacteria bacterium]|nr:NmrA family NAD(P)-binding protein [Acidobacteriota bacterium]